MRTRRFVLDGRLRRVRYPERDRRYRDRKVHRNDIGLFVRIEADFKDVVDLQETTDSDERRRHDRQNERIRTVPLCARVRLDRIALVFQYEMLRVLRHAQHAPENLTIQQTSRASRINAPVDEIFAVLYEFDLQSDRVVGLIIDRCF